MIFFFFVLLNWSFLVPTCCERNFFSFAFVFLLASVHFLVVCLASLKRLDGRAQIR